MSRVCNCNSVALPSISRNSCKFNIKQVQIFGFVDTAATGFTAPTITNAALKATWTALMAGTTPKMSISPLVYNPAATPGEDNTIGGDNSTPDGAKSSVGSAKPTSVTAEFHGAQPEQITAMKGLPCLADGGRLGVYLFNNAGEVFGVLDDTNLKPIPVDYVFTGARSLGGISADDVNSFTMELADGWDEELTSVQGSDFRGRDLITATVTSGN